MTVRIGRIELAGVQSLQTEEARTLVELRVPHQRGSAFQDLGREPVTLLLDGFLFGDGATDTMEALRAAQARAEPMPFAADLVTGLDLTDVIVESLVVRQLAGHRSRYQFVLRLREHLEQPEPTDAASAAVGALAEEEAAAWGEDNLTAAGVLLDPTVLPDALAANPGVLDALDMDEMAGALDRGIAGMSGGQLDGVLGAVAGADPAKADALLLKLRDAGSLGPMMEKYAGEGIEFLGNLEPAKLVGLARTLADGVGFLRQLGSVVRAGLRLVEDIRALDLPLAIARLLPAPDRRPAGSLGDMAGPRA